MDRKLFMLTDRSKWNVPEYAKEHYEEILVDRIDSIATGNKEDEFTEEELTEMLWNLKEVDREEGEDLRWVKPVTSIFELCGRFFAIDWYEGLTEYQSNEFYDQPYEVTKRTKQITVTEWVRKELKND
ncbi:Uncharacterised protein [uncultured Clostridium sp.]|nr:Uncharacterised protein [uncultured Clostridium sp.]